jgi:two-component system, sensor histidine kinase RegB
MLDAVHEARRVVWLAGRQPLLGSNAAEWLIGLRWVAVFGMAGTIVVAQQLVPGLRVTPQLAIVASLALLNLGWTIGPPRLRPAVSLQLAVDLVVLTAVLWFAGGMGNPFAIFLTFQVALAGLLCGGTPSVAIALLAVASAIALFFAPALPWETAVIPIDLAHKLGSLGALIGLAVFVGVASYVYRRWFDAVRLQRDRNERFAVLGRVAGGMAHEINTPLATILVAAEELVEVGRSADGDEIERLSRTIAQEARRASDVIALLRGQVRARLAERLDLSALVAEIVPHELDALHFDGQRLVDVTPGITAWGAGAAIRTILGNVLKNAVEATEGQTIRQIAVSVDRRGDRVVLAVTDNGCGIRTDALQHVGEPFNTTKESRGGTGLGLYVSSLLAEHMGASLGVEGGDGAATCVTLSLRTTRPITLGEDDDALD